MHVNVLNWPGETLIFLKGEINLGKDGLQLTLN